MRRESGERARDATPRVAPPERGRGSAVSWVDLVVIALALVAAVSGWRHGMAVALLSFVGVLGGAIIGVRVAPLLAQGINNTSTRVIVSVAVVVLLVVLGETTGVFLGRRVRDRITGERTLADRFDARLDPAGARGGCGRVAGGAAAGLGEPARHRVRGARLGGAARRRFGDADGGQAAASRSAAAARTTPASPTC